uniref:Motile sperm domain-containing protein 2 n=1 Tax=Aceria tosichella TaxID=561515 RepID=A0A6G1SIA6_9ACAR
MFKNVAQALNVTNQVKDPSKKTADSKKSKKKMLLKMPDDGEAGDVILAATIIKDEGFLVRQGRKKLSKLVTRLRNVKSLAARKNDANRNGQLEGDSMIDTSKEKVVKFKLDNDEVYYMEEKTAAYQEDSDDDDAYVSASETLGDEEEEEGVVASHSQCNGTNEMENDVESVTGQQQMSGSYSEEELANDKFILPEEQCDIPTFLHTKNCAPEIIEETRKLLKERYAKNPDGFYECDYKRMLEDDWTVTRFLLRRRLDPKRTAKLMENCGGFRRQYLMGEVQLNEFPVEFHLAGGLFRYAPDRVGNQTMYMRVKMYRRVPEISDVFKAFILCVLEQCDIASNGRGTAVVFDLSGAGIRNVDLGFLFWLLNSFRNYCPKGVSYILVLNLPWFLSATCKLAMSWLSETNRRALRFVQGKEIENFIAPENLPDYLGGTCPIDYRAIPEGSRPAVEVCDKLDITVAQALKIRQLFMEYLPENYEANLPPPPPPTVAPKITYTRTDSGLVFRHEERAAGETSSPQEDQQLLASSDNLSQDSKSTLEADSVPVVDLVSTASKFMATN